MRTDNGARTTTDDDRYGRSVGRWWRIGGDAPEIPGSGADECALSSTVVIVFADESPGDPTDEYVVRNLGAEELGLSRGGQPGGADERKQESFHTTIKTLENRRCLSAAIFPSLSGNLIFMTGRH